MTFQQHATNYAQVKLRRQLHGQLFVANNGRVYRYKENVTTVSVFLFLTIPYNEKDNRFYVKFVKNENPLPQFAQTFLNFSVFICSRGTFIKTNYRSLYLVKLKVELIFFFSWQYQIKEFNFCN